MPEAGLIPHPLIPFSSSAILNGVSITRDPKNSICYRNRPSELTPASFHPLLSPLPVWGCACGYNRQPGNLSALTQPGFISDSSPVHHRGGELSGGLAGLQAAFWRAGVPSIEWPINSGLRVSCWGLCPPRPQSMRGQSMRRGRRPPQITPGPEKRDPHGCTAPPVHCALPGLSGHALPPLVCLPSWTQQRLRVSPPSSAFLDPSTVSA